jgi:prevent-host-death family protein
MTERATVGLKELRQDASGLVRRVEDGEEIDITVAGRLAARMVPPAPKQWVRWDEIAGLFRGRGDPDWEADRDLIDHRVLDPWER